MEKIGENKNKYLIRTAIIAFLAAVLALLPSVILGKGMLLFSDDFTYQQQLFNIYYGKLYKSGEVFSYSFLSDLGSSNVYTYSFYNLFSPFTLLFAFLPQKVIPYMTAPLLALKYAVAAVFAYIYIKKFVKKEESAAFGAILYAFCGCQTVNLLFPFHDATALFPLLLIGIEEIGEGCRLRKINKTSVSPFHGVPLFALACGLCAITNYYLFFGQIIFCIIYFLFRYKFKENIPCLLKCLLGGALGVMLSAFVLLPSALSVMANPRIGSFCTDILFNWRMYLAIFMAYFMPTDVMGSRNAFLQHECNSCGLTLPFVAMALVLAYILAHKKSRFSYFCGFLVIISLVPVLNSAFSMFNGHYYARWFYCMALVFALGSAMAVDEIGCVAGESKETLPETSCNGNINKKFIKQGAKINLIATIVVGLLCLLGCAQYYLRKVDSMTEKLNFPLLIIYISLGIIFALVFFVWVSKTKFGKNFVRNLTVAVLCVAVVTMAVAGVRYSTGTSETEHYEEGIVNSEGQIGTKGANEILADFSYFSEQLDGETQNFRVRFDYHYAGTYYFANSFDNLSLLTEIPSVNSFVSTLSSGIFEFYEALGIGRNVTTMGGEDEALMLLLSCRYYLLQNKTFEAFDNFLPIGFAYDKYITTAELEEIPTEKRALAMLNYIVTDDENCGMILEENPLENMETDLAQLTIRDKSANFTTGNNSFSFSFYAEKDEAVYISIPYDGGFTAKINGEEAEIMNSCGMMVIFVNAGDNEIEFTYQTPGLSAGVGVTICGAIITALLISYNYIFRVKSRRRKLA